MATTDDLVTLGYEVGEASPGILYVNGFGSTLYVSTSDQATIDNLADPVLYAARLAPDESLPVVQAKAAVALPKSATLADVIAAVNALTA